MKTVDASGRKWDLEEEMSGRRNCKERKLTDGREIKTIERKEDLLATMSCEGLRMKSEFGPMSRAWPYRFPSCSILCTHIGSAIASLVAAIACADALDMSGSLDCSLLFCFSFISRKSTSFL